MVTYNNLGMAKPVVGGSLNTWGDELNTSLTLISDYTSAVLTHSVSASGTIVLTYTEGASDQERNAHFKFTGAITSNTTILWPNAKSRMFSVHNATTGSYTLRCGANDGAGALAGTAVTITQGDTVMLGSTGTDVFTRQTAGGSPTGAAGGVLTGTYPNPTLAALSPSPAGTITAGALTISSAGIVTAAAAGVAGGGLTGTYPNPTLADLSPSPAGTALANPTITVSAKGLVTAAAAGAAAASAASQADMEAASSTTAFVSPGRVKYSPFSPKAWAYCNGATGAVISGTGLTFHSIAGTGIYRYTISPAMSSANYATFVTGVADNPSDIQATEDSTGKTSSAVIVHFANGSGSATTPDFFSILIMGDQ